MTREDVIRMAREVGYPLAEYETGPYVPPLLETLLKHAVAAEREACAAICDRFQARDVGMQPAECAGAIRARGQA